MTTMRKIKLATLAIICTLLLSACGASHNDSAYNFPPAPTATVDTSWDSEQVMSAPMEDVSWDAATFDDAWTPPALEADNDTSWANNETHLAITENTWVNPEAEAAISFTLQIDTASYRNVTRMINNGQLPHPDAVRIAEMINYFNYDIVTPSVEGTPFSIYTEIGSSPFNTENYLAFVRVRAQDICREELPASNLTFLIDTSGSMASANRLPLVQQSLGLLVPELDENDIVSIVTYAGCARVLLDSVPGNQHEYIMDAINSLVARGSTAGGPGISMAYQLAMQNYNPEMNNRIILATDGDFNVGVSTVSELYEMMAEYRRRGIHMTILGFGMGNFRDDMLETIARNGNANYHYIDNIQAAYKVFVEELISNMFVIAEDVRAQVEFNPALVENYRLIGYENRRIDNADFDNDFRDAGEIGVGSEIVLMFEFSVRDEALQANPHIPLFEVRIRYHEPGDFASQLITVPVTSDKIFSLNSSDFTFAAAVAAFGHILRDSEHVGNATYTQVLEMARRSLGEDRGGHRRGFVDLVEQYRVIR